MTTTGAAAPAATAATPRPSRRRAVLGWLTIAAVVVGVAVAGGALTYSGYTERSALDPESAGAEGTRAIVRILGQHGVDVTVARDRGAAEQALAAGPATLVMRDAPALSDASVQRLADAAHDVVLVEPRSRTLGLLLAGSRLGGFGDAAPAAPACDVPAAEAAGPVALDELYVAGDGVTGCYPADGEHGLLVLARDGGTVAAVDGRSILTNAQLRTGDNAALAVGLLGRNARLVWYVPSLSDADTAAAQTVGELTPPWVTPAMALLVLSIGAAIVWRGRRFGPLVTERLPVMVRASETTEGRARLYAASRDAPHAIGELRRAALVRLARQLGLAPRADPARIADAVAERLGADRGVVRGILIDRLPRTDRELVDASDRLRDLEASVRAALRTERTPR